jgi:hypothetical protein
VTTAVGCELSTAGVVNAPDEAEAPPRDEPSPCKMLLEATTGDALLDGPGARLPNPEVTPEAALVDCAGEDVA